MMHRRLHTGKRPYKCSIDGCSKYFAHKSVMRQHQRQSHGPQPKKVSLQWISWNEMVVPGSHRKKNHSKPLKEDERMNKPCSSPSSQQCLPGSPAPSEHSSTATEDDIISSPPWFSTSMTLPMPNTFDERHKYPMISSPTFDKHSFYLHGIPVSYPSYNTFYQSLHPSLITVTHFKTLFSTWIYVVIYVAMFIENKNKLFMHKISFFKKFNVTRGNILSCHTYTPIVLHNKSGERISSCTPKYSEIYGSKKEVKVFLNHWYLIHTASSIESTV